jgi:triosephosphate isomerase
MILINYKAYRKATGNNTGALTEKIESAAEKTEKEIAVAPQTADLNRVNSEELQLFSQHTDPVDTGSHTGSNQIKAVKDTGATGTLINHSEKRQDPEKIRKTVEICDENDITTVVCAQTPKECEKYADFSPDYIAFEPPELIGGDVSVSKSEPELIEKAVEKSGEVSTLTGAGIKTREDVEKSIELGCEGVLVASGVIKSKDVEKEIIELCDGL